LLPAFLHLPERSSPRLIGVFLFREKGFLPLILLGPASFVNKYPDIYLQYKELQLGHAHNTFWILPCKRASIGLAFLVSDRNGDGHPS